MVILTTGIMFLLFTKMVRGGPKAVSEEKRLQKLYQTLDE
jgi:hypothetical protein